MTLKDKLFDAIFEQSNTYKRKNAIIDVEQIADDYAIEFAEWLMKIRFKSIEKLTAKELLEIFKKEKGL